MEQFNLPERTLVNRVVPKNAFDDYTSSKLKKLFSDTVKRITWVNKLSSDTINLNVKDIVEIQFFKIVLKQKTEIPRLLEVIDKAIPYHIVFWVEFEGEAYISTSSKHPHVTNNDIAVIDWVFVSDWFSIGNIPYELKLKGTLDDVFKDLCVQIIGESNLQEESMESILTNQQEIHRLKREISKLKLAISKASQFNKKVELNGKLHVLKKELKRYTA